MKRILLMTIALALTLSACKQNNGKSQTNSQVKSRNPQEMAKEIDTIEHQLFNEKASTINTVKAKKLVEKYMLYANTFPEDSLAPEYLYKASDISMNLNQPGQTISIYNRLINKYAGYKNIPTCYFLKAFVYDDQLKDYTKAKKFYQLYLDKYPKGEFADDAHMALKYLGKSPEELIKTFEKKNKK